MVDPGASRPSKPEVVAALKEAAVHRRLHVHPRCQKDIDFMEYDNEGVMSIIAECDHSELDQSEPDKDVTRNDWIAVLKVELEEEEMPIYLKVALKRPELRFGLVLAFKPWGS